MQIKKHLFGTRTRDLPVCSIVPQPTTLPRAPIINLGEVEIVTKEITNETTDLNNERGDQIFWRNFVKCSLPLYMKDANLCAETEFHKKTSWAIKDWVRTGILYKVEHCYLQAYR
jgi:hypothetical protein